MAGVGIVLGGERAGDELPVVVRERADRLLELLNVVLDPRARRHLAGQRVRDPGHADRTSWLARDQAANGAVADRALKRQHVRCRVAGNRDHRRLWLGFVRCLGVYTLGRAWTWSSPSSALGPSHANEAQHCASFGATARDRVPVALRESGHLIGPRRPSR
jgi:hypothetical protein